MRIATYNVKNFFDSLDPHRSKPESEVKALATTIDRFKPDILGLQEVESEDSLEELNDLLDTKFRYRELIEGNSYRDINVAFMSHKQINMTSHKGLSLTGPDGKTLYDYPDKRAYKKKKKERLKFQRDLVLAEFSLGGGKRLAVWNMHLKSRSSRKFNALKPDEIRWAEANKAESLIEAYADKHPNHPIVVLGDLNQTHGHKSIRPLIKGLGYFDPVLEEQVKKGKAVTTYWKKKRDRIDYVLLSPTAESAYEAKSAKVYTGKTAQKASDHYAVYVDLDL